MRERTRLLSVLAGVSFTILTMRDLFMLVEVHSKSHPEFDRTVILALINVTAFIVFAVLSWIGKKNTGWILASALYLVQPLVNGITNGVNAALAFRIAAAVSMLVLAVFTCLPALKDKGGLIRHLWFVPGLLIFIQQVVLYLQTPLILFFIFAYFEITALIFAGLWMVQKE